MIYGERELEQRRDMIWGAPLYLYGGAFPQNEKKSSHLPHGKYPFNLPLPSSHGENAGTTDP
jgi:hypothetical protein